MDSPQLAPTTHRPIPRRLAKFVKQAEEENLITTEAFQTFLNLCNPFPDDSIEPSGWPGIHAVKTVCNAITQYADLSAPAGTTATWNFHAVMLPATYFSIFGAGLAYNTATGALTGGTAPAGNNQGMFIYWTWKDADAIPNFNTALPTGTLLVHTQLPPGCETRLTAGGIEAINTSALIDRSGFGYAYRLQNTYATSSFMPTALGANQILNRNVIFQSPPNNPNEIVNMSTTYTGSAERGIVVVNLPTSVDNPFAPSIATTNFFLDRVNGLVTVSNPNSFGSYNWSTAGIFVTGLKPSASFKLKVRAYFEGAPLTSGGYNQTIARSGVPYSPLMTELACNTIASMPAGFDYAENPFGEWMSRVLDLASHAFPAVGKVLPFPGASAIGSSLGALAGAGSKALAPNQKKKVPAKAGSSAKKTAVKPKKSIPPKK